MSTSLVAQKSERFKAIIQSDNFRAEVAQALPAHIRPERFQRVLLTSVINDARLLDVAPVKVVKAALKIAPLGLFTDHLWFLLVLFWVTAFWIVALSVLKKCGHDTAVAGGMVALVAALCVQNYGQWIKWYCLWEAPSFILCYYLGIVAFRNREALDPLRCKKPPHEENFDCDGHG